MLVALAAIPFIHPALAGIALVTGLIPVIIHLINRRRFTRIPWAAMTFLIAANQRSIRRIRIERLLLLLTRMALIVLFGFALARPYVTSSSFLPMRTSRVHRVLILDNSLSMNARPGDGPSRFTLAKEYAEHLLDTFPATDPVSLVTSARPAQAVVAQAAYDRRFVRQQLAGITATLRPSDTVGALNAAAEILEQADVAEGNRAVYFFSDLPQRDWVNETMDGGRPAVSALRRLAGLLADSSVDLNVVRVTGEERTTLSDPENLAVVGITVESMLASIDLPVRIHVEVQNFGSTTARDAHLQIRRDGQILRRERLPPLEPEAVTTATVTTTFSTEGTHLIEARLSPRTVDMLREDDARYHSFEVRRTTPVLVIDGRPGPTPLRGQSGFFTTALAPKSQTLRPIGFRDRDSTTGSAPTPAEPKVISVAELAGEPLDAYDVVALCNVPQLSSDAWNRLTAFVERGGGVMLFLGELVNTDNYNAHGYAQGSGILPGELSDPARARDFDSPVGLELSKTPHPITAEFEGKPESGLFSVRVDRYLPLALDITRAAVVLQYSDGHPALVASSMTSGSGRVLLFTSTANLEWNNLPAKGDFVSLMINSIAFLAPEHGKHRNMEIGQAVYEPLLARQHGLPLRLTVGSGAAIEPAVVPAGSGLAVSIGPFDRAEPVTLSIGPEVRSFAANVDPAESDLAVTKEETFVSAVARPVRVLDAAELRSAVHTKTPMGRSTELAGTLVYLVIALTFAECWMGMWFGAPRSTGRGGDRASA